jgi:membrane protease YdiL (CAAX protease family)
MPEPGLLQLRLRHSVWLAVAEFAIVAGLFYADVHHHVFVSKTPYLFLLGWASLRLRGMRWKDVGFARPRSWKKAVLVGIAVGVAMEALELFITQPLLARWLGKMPDLSDFAGVAGSLKVLLIYLVLIWTLGPLGEEVDYRGYLMNRVAGVFRETKAAWIVSLVAVSVVFGCGHLDQGATGMLENVWNGLLLGALYLACGRNLAIPIIAHATTDTMDLVLMYLRKYPGMH